MLINETSLCCNNWHKQINLNSICVHCITTFHLGLHMDSAVQGNQRKVNIYVHIICCISFSSYEIQIMNRLSYKTLLILIAV